MKKIFLLLVVCMQVSSAVSAGTNNTFPTPIHLFKNLEAWRDMKFGLLMHLVLAASGALSKVGVCPEDLSWQVVQETCPERLRKEIMKPCKPLSTLQNSIPPNGQTQQKEAV